MNPNPGHTEQARWFAEEVQPHEPDLRAWLGRRFPGLSDVDDLVQDSFLKLVRARNSGRVAEARPYLFAVARNAALDRFRRDRVSGLGRAVDADSVALVGESADAAALSDRDRQMTMLTEAIEALPTRCRLVLKLRKLQGLSHREIAGRLGVSENTVNAQIAKGVARCREYFQAQGLLPN